MPKMYEDLAAWWPLLSPPSEYQEEAALFLKALEEATSGPLRRVVEFGSGGGNNASHMKARVEMVLVEPAAGMLEVSRRLNPDCEHAQGDMRTARLGRQFDGVFIHDAICYMTSLEDLRRAIDTAFVHLRPGGGAVFAPDFLRDTFCGSTDSGGTDAPDGRGLRFVEWAWDPDPSDTLIRVDYAFLLRSADGAVTIDHDCHIEGLFTRAEWLRTIEDAGFTNIRSIPVEHSELEPGTYEIFAATRPA